MKTLEYLVIRLTGGSSKTHAVIGPRRAEREALQIYLAKVREVIDIGNWNPAFYQNYLTVQQQFAVAIAAEFRAIADYNTSLAIFEFAKGTMQQYNNVTIGEGPLPPWVCKKAADHIRERTSAALQAPRARSAATAGWARGRGRHISWPANRDGALRQPAALRREAPAGAGIPPGDETNGSEVRPAEAHADHRREGRSRRTGATGLLRSHWHRERAAAQDANHYQHRARDAAAVPLTTRNSDPARGLSARCQPTRRCRRSRHFPNRDTRLETVDQSVIRRPSSDER